MDPIKMRWGLQSIAMLVGALIVSGLGGVVLRGTVTGAGASSATTAELERRIESMMGERTVLQIQLNRANAIIDYSAHYRIPADLAATIYDVALREGLNPDLAFRLVHVESRFDPKARSRVGAIGYAQVMVPTAHWYQPGITEEQLYDRETNLKLGFRYLRDLLRRHKGDMRLALLSYNRGPARVQELLNAGRNPNNGYERSVMSGYKRGRS